MASNESISQMAIWSWLYSDGTIRKLLAVSPVARSSLHRAFNSLEKSLLERRALTQHAFYDSYRELEKAVPAREAGYDSDATIRGPFESEKVSTNVDDLTDETAKDLLLEDEDFPEEDVATQEKREGEQPIHSQFGPIGSQDHRYISQHKGGALPQHIMDEPAYYYTLTTYIGYMILVILGHIRDFFGKRFKPEKYKGFKEQDGYAALNSDFDNFYFRRVKRLLDDCFKRAMTGVPGRYITLMDRMSYDNNETFQFTGTYTTTLNMSSYNYLGFAQSSGPCADDVHACISAYGISSTSPRLEVGTSDLTVEVEREIANFVGKEDAMVFSMGFCTNATSFPALVGPGCLIISDELNHASIRVGARLSGAAIESYKHNDMDDLEKVLKKQICDKQPRTHKPWQKILVVCEGLFSMEGTIADLPGLIRLRKKYKFYLFVDEAHSIGALGPRGRGVCDYFNIDPSEVDILMGTLTKAFGANGGYVAADKAIIQKLRQTNAAMHYGESTSPPVLMQILSSLRQISSTAVGRERLQRIAFNSRYLRLGLKRLGFIVYGHEDSPVIPMMLYHIGKLPAFSRQMLKRKISVVVVGYPATPILTARVRFCVSAAHNKEDMDRVLAACDEIGDILDLKFSTGRMGAIERPLKGMRLADVKKYKSARKPVAPRWKLEDVIANGVRDAKIQLV